MLTTLSPVQQPQQARSRESMNQMLDAAAQILETKTFEALTIAEVVERAGTSVGSFYGRFKDKDGLLHALDERFFQEFEQDFAAMVSQPDWPESPVAVIIRDAARFLVETYSKQSGVLRSLNLKARLYGDPGFQAREQRAWKELYPLLRNILLAHQAEMTHPNPSLAIHLGFQQMFFTLREILLWDPLHESRSYEKEELIVELVRAYLAYLGIQEA